MKNAKMCSDGPRGESRLVRRMKKVKNPAVCLKLAHANSFICMHAHIYLPSHRACNIVKSYITFNHYSNLVFLAMFVSFRSKKMRLCKVEKNETNGDSMSVSNVRLPDYLRPGWPPLA